MTIEQSLDFDALSEAQLRAAGGLKWTTYPDCIGAFVAEMDFGTAPPVRAALRAMLERQQFGYLTLPLLDELAEACAHWHAQRYGWAPDPRRVQPLPDVLTGLELALRHLLPAGAAVALPTPNYMPFLPLLRMLGHRVIQVPMLRTPDGWRFDYAALDAAFADGARLAILCNPHNPIGRVFSREELDRFCDVVARHDGRVFCDEIHAPLVFAPHRHLPYAALGERAAAQAITATSASKGWNLPGLKCAQLILTNDDDLRQWRRMAPLAGHATATPGAIANIAAYREGGPWLDGVVDYLRGNRARMMQLLRERLPLVDCVEPEGTYLAWLDFRRLPLPEAPHLFFRKAGVALTDGGECGAVGAGHVRINFAMPRPILERAIARMAEAVAAAA